MAATITVQPVEEPVSKAEAKRHLLIDVETLDYDDEVTRLIVAARQHFERETNRSLVSRTVRLDLRNFPGSCGAIRLPFGPVVSVTSITYIDQSDPPATVDAADYVVDLTPDVPTITPAWDETWPTMTPRPGGVSVTYVAGYGAAAAVPDDARHAILLIVGHWFNTREAVSDKPLKTVPIGAQRVIDNLHIAQLA